jgi:hypothetical protein
METTNRIEQGGKAMFLHPDLMLTVIHDRQRDLIEIAERRRLFATLRRHHDDEAVDVASRPAARGRADGTLAGCGTPAAAPAR